MKNNAYLGIDIGSISTKGVIIDEQNNEQNVTFTDEQIEQWKKESKIKNLTVRLNQLSQDFTQHSLVAIFDDIEERKAEFIKLHNELRVLMGKEPREYNIRMF